MTKNEAALRVSLLRQLIRLEPETGDLYWLSRVPSLFQAGSRSMEHRCAVWNAQHAGRPALAHIARCGYRTGNIFNKPFLAHRVAFALHSGTWPKNQVDHINGTRTDNRPCNLRDVPKRINQRNKQTPANNTSGDIGVRYRPDVGKWHARIMVDRKAVHLGYFGAKDDAIAARKSAEQQFGFHANHGRKAA